MLVYGIIKNTSRKIARVSRTKVVKISIHIPLESTGRNEEQQQAMMMTSKMTRR